MGSHMTHLAVSDADLSHLVERQAVDGFFSSHAWLNLITTLYRYPLTTLTTTATEQVTGFLPICSVRSPLTGHRLVSLPFSDYCQPLALDQSCANLLFDRAIALVQQERAAY